MIVSAVILAYNRCSEVLLTVGKMKALVPSLPFQLEIVVVDNASADDTTTQLTVLHPDIVLITKKKNNGIAGWNEGFMASSGGYMLVLDDDSHLESGFPEAIYYLNNHPEVGILALNVTTGPYLTEAMQWKDKQDIAGFFGCGAIIRREVFTKIGGFAEWLHVYTHEYEYGIRCLDAGYKIRYFQNSNVIHRASTAGRSYKRIRIYSTRNEMAIVYKYFGNDRWKLLLRMWGNNLKHIKEIGPLLTYYEMVGSVKFLQMKKHLEYTPVSPETQQFFAAEFLNPHPVFGFITKRINKLLKKG